MWTFFRKRRALRTYKTTLATKLRQRYGRERYYTPDQVWRTALDHGIRVDFLCFALCMFCERDAFDAFHAASGDPCDYTAMRAEVGGVDLTSGHDHGHVDANHHDSHYDGDHGHHDFGHHDFTGFDGGDGGCSSD